MIVVLKYSYSHLPPPCPTHRPPYVAVSVKNARANANVIHKFFSPSVCDTIAKASKRSVNGMLAPNATSTLFLSWLALSWVNMV